MCLNLRNIGDFYIIDLHNQIFERKFVNDLKNTVNSLIDNDVQNILIDFTKVENIDSIGLGVLLTIQKISLFHNIKIRLYGLKPNLMQIIQQTQLNRVMDICDVEDDTDDYQETIDALIA